MSRPPTPPRRRLGWIGIAIVALGVVVAAVGVWAIIHGRPKVGAVIDTINVDDHEKLVIHREADGGERYFVDNVIDGRLMWQAMIPPYGGRPGVPGIAWSQHTVSVRVIRDHRAEIFALSRDNSAKLGGFKLAPGRGPVVKQTVGPVTISDHVKSYELVEGKGWHQLVAFDLATGKGVWLQDLPSDPITDAGLRDGMIWIEQGGVRRSFDVTDGSERPTSENRAALRVPAP